MLFDIWFKTTFWFRLVQSISTCWGQFNLNNNFAQSQQETQTKLSYKSGTEWQNVLSVKRKCQVAVIPVYSKSYDILHTLSLKCLFHLKWKLHRTEAIHWQRAFSIQHLPSYHFFFFNNQHKSWHGRRLIGVGGEKWEDS